MYGIAGPENGYIPYRVVPCERNIGDTLTFVTALSLGPVVTCPLVPWLCCPLDFSDSPTSISPVIECSEIGAIYGSIIFWSMQIFNVFGLIFAITGLARCITEKTDDSPGSQVALSFDISDALAEKLEDKNEIEITPVNYVKKRIYDALRDVYRKQVVKSQSKDEPESRDDDIPPATIIYNATIAVTSESHSNRTKRQTTLINVPIPTLLGHVPGPDDPDVDVCERDEVIMDDGDCYELLEQGPCEDDSFVIMDPRTKTGFCAPRLCAPGKVFLFNDQLCHDPNEAGLCPPGRMLFTSSFGTPLCGCPDGTYEEDDDLDDNVCEPVLGNIPNCPRGQVFWFSDFRRPPTCLPDPCKGVNLKRGPEDLPYIPSLFDGKCYRVGSQPHFCRSDQFYSMSLKFLRGVCSSLDEAGYTVLDDGDISSLTRTFGDFITNEGESSKRRDSAKPNRLSFTKPTFLSAKPSRRKLTPASTTLLTRPEIGSPVMKMANASFHMSPILIGQSVIGGDDSDLNEVESTHPMLALVPTHMSAFSTPLITVDGSTTTLFSFLPGAVPMHRFGKRSFEEDDDDDSSQVFDRRSSSRRAPRHHRRKRSPLPFASPGNVIEPGLTACRAGAIRDINAKCRSTVLPSRFPPRRPVRDVSAVRPRPSCPGGGLWGLGRTCSSRGSGGIASIINRLGLG